LGGLLDTLLPAPGPHAPSQVGAHAGLFQKAEGESGSGVQMVCSLEHGANDEG